jgi:antitoxin component YwqK of YwqJK toxin-antitoxin module
MPHIGRLNPRGLLACSALACVTALTACGNRTLDYRNTQIVNGKVYESDANTAFSGRLTNVPARILLQSQQGFVSLTNLLEKVRPTTTVGDTGISSICDADIHDGLLDGKAVCKVPQSDIVRLEAEFSDGTLNGPFAIRNQTGDATFVSVTFREGVVDGKLQIDSETTHKLIYVVSFADGVPGGSEETFDENTGNRTSQVTIENGRYEGKVTRWAPDGRQVIYTGSYSNGGLEGLEEAFDPATGAKIEEAHWSGGKLNGESQRWDAQGTLVALKTYQNGFLATTSDEKETRYAYGQDSDHPAVYVPLQGTSATPAVSTANQGVQSPDDKNLANQIHAVEENAPAANPAPQVVQPAPVVPTAAPVAATPTPPPSADNVPSINSLSVDGPAVKRCGWIENDMPSGLALKDREGTWNIVGGTASGTPSGFDQMPPTNKGDSCGCLTVQTHHASMQIVHLLGGSLKPISACQKDNSLN